MAPRMVYLAYPIDQVAGRIDDDLAKLYAMLEQTKISLLQNGVDIVYDPGDAFRVRAGAEAGPEIRSVNQQALSTADAVLALMPLGLPSVGVPMEVDSAVVSGKAVAIVTDVSAWMLRFGEYADYQRFSPDLDGFDAAATWLLAHERASAEREYEPLPFMVVDRGAEITVDLTPRRTYEDDAGWDLVTARQTTIQVGETVDVPCGIAIQLPDWAWGRITGRSSTMRKRGLLVNEGIIDTGFRGELFVCVTNMDSTPTTIEPGERIGQLILHANDSAAVRPVQVQDLVASERGTNGFGSTGQ